MEPNDKQIRIGVFGHYGNKNLGDESIIEAVIKNLRATIPGCEIICLSIDPFDSRSRYSVDSFPIRFRADFFSSGPVTVALDRTIESQPESDSAPISQPTPSLKQHLKTIPLLGQTLKAAARAVDGVQALKREIAFLKTARRYVDGLDLLLVTGSNQFLDNFGGPWGFPYTLMKWTALAKSADVKVAFISVGAGPLDRPLSLWFLKWALRRADFVSVRDEGSRDLLHKKIGIAPNVFPDIAHSLQTEIPIFGHRDSAHNLIVAVNPMPVYDSRYWYEADDRKFRAYVDKLSELCAAILTDGHELELFSTQSKDENVIDDIIDRLQTHAAYSDWSQRINVVRTTEVSQLMDTIGRADIVVATRFHGTVLPLQLGKPVLGVCYYRKAAELLDDVGLNEYWVDLDDFESPTLIRKYRSLLEDRHEKSLQLEQHMLRYSEKLATQYQAIKNLVVTSDSPSLE
ncbi:polysaccharide pyruvyl transferase family protein [Marinobacter caseinilyticus]|uniref:polysaccharide pyruvyl transferase family protein n=1 Tax=Marinobacter caseinilyticus TaxID=2692195 RepID=UPI00140D2FC8|nr:polysaccharide pyruvyl transferase family protein [Marinobacter caseinilyticus]